MPARISGPSSISAGKDGRTDAGAKSVGSDGKVRCATKLHDQTSPGDGSSAAVAPADALATSQRVTTSGCVMRHTKNAMPMPMTAPGYVAIKTAATVKSAYALLSRVL